MRDDVIHYAPDLVEIADLRAEVAHHRREKVALRTRCTELEAALRFYANPGTERDDAAWSSGYPGGIVYYEKDCPVIDTGQIAIVTLGSKGGQHEG